VRSTFTASRDGGWRGISAYNQDEYEGPYRFGVWLVDRNQHIGGQLTSDGGKAVTTDRLGSTRAKDAERYTYFPYGEARTATVSGGGLYAGLENPLRVYDAGSGRFNRPDPLGLGAVKLGDPGSWNRFAYVQGDPVNYNDPAGLNFWSKIWNAIKGTLGVSTAGSSGSAGSGGGDIANPDGAQERAEEDPGLCGTPRVTSTISWDTPLPSTATAILSSVYGATSGLAEAKTWGALAAVSCATGVGAAAAWSLLPERSNRTWSARLRGLRKPWTTLRRTASRPLTYLKMLATVWTIWSHSWGKKALFVPC
jgi:RHS repeat-associated protein